MIILIALILIGIIAWLIVPKDDRLVRKIKFVMFSLCLVSLLFFIKEWYYNKGVDDANRYHLTTQQYK